jgi:hypothetical protein
VAGGEWDGSRQHRPDAPGTFSVRPKLIASTATIKNADVQVRSLFLRTVNIFPPPGLDVRDNFFSVQREPTGEGVWPAVSSASCAAGSPAEGGV